MARDRAGAIARTLARRRAGAIARTLIIAAGLAGCAARPRALTASHPASTTAPVGRLAGPPAILHARPADLLAEPEPEPESDHSHGAHP